MGATTTTTTTTKSIKIYSVLSEQKAEVFNIPMSALLTETYPENTTYTIDCSIVNTDILTITDTVVNNSTLVTTNIVIEDNSIKITVPANTLPIGIVSVVRTYVPLKSINTGTKAVPPVL